MSECQTMKARFFLASFVGGMAVLSSCNYYETKGVFTSPGTGRPGDTFQTMSRDLFTPFCMRCHQGGEAAGGLELDNYAALVDGGALVPGDAPASYLYEMVVEQSMPPRGGMPSADLIERLRRWIEAGAPEN